MNSLHSSELIKIGLNLNTLSKHKFDLGESTPKFENRNQTNSMLRQIRLIDVTIISMSLVIIFFSVLSYQIEFKREDRVDDVDQRLQKKLFTVLMICSVVLGFFNVLHAVVLFKFERLRKSLIAREHRLTLEYIAINAIETLAACVVPLQSFYDENEKLIYFNMSINQNIFYYKNDLMNLA